MLCPDVSNSFIRNLIKAQNINYTALCKQMVFNGRALRIKCTVERFFITLFRLCLRQNSHGVVHHLIFCGGPWEQQDQLRVVFRDELFDRGGPAYRFRLVPFLSKS